MFPGTAFRLNTYLTLALACAGLGYAESAMLPEVGVFAVIVVLALAVIYRLEPRINLLTLDDANRLGAAIAICALVWAGFRVVREYRTGEFESYGWPVFVISLIAPLLMALICGKLLRREKHAGDYWYMHAAGLAAMVLAGAIDEHADLAALTAAYAFCSMWSLASFYTERTGGIVPVIPPRKATAEAPGPRIHYVVGAAAPRNSPGLFRVAGWFCVAAGAAAAIYLLTPRSPFGRFQLDQARIEIGYAADQMIDLTQTGDLRVNTETAFEVDAVDSNGQPKTDLDAGEQRWRGAVLASYTSGTWKREALLPFPTAPATSHPNPWAPPDFGPSGYRLTFTVPTKLRATFLSDPVAWLPDEPAPVAEFPEGGAPQPWLPFRNGAVFGRTGSFRSAGEYLRYVQYTRPPREPNLSPPYSGGGEVNRTLSTNMIPSVQAYADKVVADSVAAGRLPAAALRRDPVRLMPLEQYHEAIAHAFRDHLSTRSDLVYSTELRRENKTVDPVVDFLFYSKTGHCERFATALVLMLRSEGIPAVMVLGFKGCEHAGDGHYVIRQDHAHAWAEALIARQDPADPRRRNWHWLSLDASPAQAVESASAGSVDSLFARTRNKFEQFIFHYSAEQREKAIHGLLQAIASQEFLYGAGLTAILILGAGYARRRIFSRPQLIVPNAVHWFDQLVELLAKHGFEPAPGQTRREFAESVAQTLAHRSAAYPIHVLRDWVEAYYENRFGGTVIADERLAKLEDDLHELKRALGEGRT
jgi:transglutaminase-like putative cysteine protease